MTNEPIPESVVVSVIGVSVDCFAPVPAFLRRWAVAFIQTVAQCLGVQFRALILVSEQHTIGGHKITVPLGVRLLGESEASQLQSAKCRSLIALRHASPSRN